MFQNKEIRRYTIQYVLMTAVIGVVLFFVLNYGIGRIEQTYLRELTKLGDLGADLEKYGYFSYLLTDYNGNIRRSVWFVYGLLCVVFLAVAILGYILGLRLHHIPADTIRIARQTSDLVLSGEQETAEQDIIPLSMQEGDIGVFWESYQKMVTAIAQAREDAEKEKLFLQDLIADISHQLKTPLATLTIYQDLLDNAGLPDSERREMLKRMGQQLNRMEWLILNLLKLARLEAGSIRFEPKMQPLYRTFLLAVNNVKPLAEAKRQRIEIECPQDMMLFHDREWLVEALTNILKNATEYAPKDSVVELAAEQSPVMTRILVKDYGIGIPPEEQHKVFERFYRAKSKINENSIGIGLALSKSIVTGQGGEIYVESEPGRYTSFIITF